MESHDIKILPEAEEFLEYLPVVLQEQGYKDDYSHAMAYVDEIIDFIYKIPFSPHYDIPQHFHYHFERYGMNLQYAFFKRKSSKTTWYVFFEQKGDSYLVKHISNNWVEGQYLR